MNEYKFALRDIVSGKCIRQLSTTPATPPIPIPRDSQTAQLPDGRTLGYSEYGSSNPSDKAIFYFYGTPSSRLAASWTHDIASSLGARIICVDRPGFGLSTFLPSRKNLDWPTDVLHLLRHLRIDHFRVLGASGGGPYALACARALPRDVLRGVGVWSGVGPREAGWSDIWPEARLLWNLYSCFPSAVRLVVDNAVVPMVQNPNRAMLKARFLKEIAWMPEAEKAVLYGKDGKSVDTLLDSVRESFRQGSRGYLQEMKLLARPWGFQVEDISFEHVRLWYGTEDVNTPARMGCYIADRLKRPLLQVWVGHTHFTSPVGGGERVLRAMLRDIE